MVDILFIGLSLGSILLLVALGLTITYGTMGVIHMAHGEMVMLGAYTTVLAGIHLGMGFLPSIALAFMVTALVGLAIERVLVRRLYGRLIDTLLATWASRSCCSRRSGWSSACRSSASTSRASDLACRTSPCPSSSRGRCRSPAARSTSTAAPSSS